MYYTENEARYLNNKNNMQNREMYFYLKNKQAVTE
jgi:hypothetical protein